MIGQKKYNIVFVLAVISVNASSAQVTREPYLRVPAPDGIAVKWQPGTGESGQRLLSHDFFRVRTMAYVNSLDTVFAEIKSL